MKTASAGLISHITQETTTLAWCWKVTRQDGAIYGFTTHDDDLTLSGQTYLAATGFAASAAQSKLGASVDNMDISGAIEGSVISEADILAGLWDGADIVVSVCNWADLSQGSMIVQTGTIGNVEARGNGYIAEMRSLSQSLQQIVGKTMTRRCDADVGDTRCGISLASHTVTGTVSADSSDARTFSASALPASIGGLLTWTSGSNAGMSMEVKTAAAGAIALVLPMPNSIDAGDAYSVHAGCDKNLSTCRDIFNNVAAFRGFPFIPGPDAVLAYPNAS